MKAETKKKNSNAWLLTGQCTQWIIEREDISSNDLKIYLSILRYSFGFRKRWCYLKYEDFNLSKATVNKCLKNLKDKGIISYKNTFKEDGKRSLNEYKILEPKQYIDAFIFISSKEDKKDTKAEEIKNVTRAIFG